MKKRIFTIIIIMALLMLSSCSKTKRAGTYEGIGNGRNGNVRVSVTIDSEGNISEIELIDFTENRVFVDASFDKLKNDIISKNNIKVDTVSGATETSNAILEAIEKAIEQSK